MGKSSNAELDSLEANAESIWEGLSWSWISFCSSDCQNCLFARFLDIVHVSSESRRWKERLKMFFLSIGHKVVEVDRLPYLLQGNVA